VISSYQVNMALVVRSADSIGGDDSSADGMMESHCLPKGLSIYYCNGEHELWKAKTVYNWSIMPNRYAMWPFSNCSMASNNGKSTLCGVI
jgi:hypothetical protein